MLGIGVRQVGRLVVSGDLAAPMSTPGGRMWRREDVEACRQRRLQLRPSNRRWARLAPASALTAHVGRRDLARAMLQALEAAGPAVVLEVFRQHGALQGVKGWPAQRIHQLAAALYQAAELVRFR
jgi:hypothetical protein